jgi:hypothetical protein
MEKGGVLLSSAQIRAWLRNLNIGSDLSPTAATNNSPAVISVSTTSLKSGDLVASWGFTTNTNCNGVFYVAVINSTTLNLVSLSDGATLIAGNGSTTAGHLVRLSIGLNPHDLLNMVRTLGGFNFGAQDSDSTWLAASAAQTALSNVDGTPGFLESPIQTIFETNQGIG